MYIPSSFAETNLGKLHDFIDSHSFATLITGGATLIAMHIPLLLEREQGSPGRLIGHVAKANPHWKQAGEGETLAIFHGPHAYISPAWYESKNVVPTWNYVAVHVYGVMEIIDDRQHRLEIVRRYVERYESTREAPWSLDSADEQFIDKLLDAIVGFEIRIDRIEAAWKLNQNHTPERRGNVIRELRHVGGEDREQIAALMAATFEKEIE